MTTARIYIATHKKYNLSDCLKQKGYEVISMGNACGSNEGADDNTGDNISFKNSNFCELTALYWIWKNGEGGSYRGFCHYRRYFTKAAISQKEQYFVGAEEIEQYFAEKYEYILPYKSRYVRNADYNYLKTGRKKDLNTLRDVIQEKYPEYIKDFDYIMSHNWSYLTNMMITTYEKWNLYCEWLFDILFEVERRTDLNGYSAAEERIYGYMSERLLSVWIIHNRCKVKEMRSVNIEERQNIRYLFREVLIKLKLYQLGKTILWRLKVIK